MGSCNLVKTGAKYFFQGNIVLLFALLAIVGIPWYLAEAAFLADEIKKAHPVEWEAVGRPSFFVPSGQDSLLRIIIGMLSLPDSISGIFASSLQRVRVAAIVAGTGVVGIFAILIAKG